MTESSAPLDAKARLLAHAGTVAAPDGAVPWLRQTFRPYRGLDDSSFVDVLNCVYDLSEVLGREQIDRDLAQALIGLVVTVRHDGLSPRSSLQRNKLMTPADTRRLEQWADSMEEAVYRLLGRKPIDLCFFPFLGLIANEQVDVGCSAERWLRFCNETLRTMDDPGDREVLERARSRLTRSSR